MSIKMSTLGFLEPSAGLHRWAQRADIFATLPLRQPSSAAASHSASPKPSRFVLGSARAVKASTTSGLKQDPLALGKLETKASGDRRSDGELPLTASKQSGSAAKSVVFLQGKDCQSTIQAKWGLPNTRTTATGGCKALSKAPNNRALVPKYH